MRSPGSKIALLFVLLATAACSTDPDSTGAAAPASSPPPTTSTPAASAAMSSSLPTPPGEVDAAETIFFISPTGNIACSIAGANAVCEIRKHTFKQPERPSDCDLDYGTMVAVEGRQPARFLCHGDTAFGATGSVLAYGERLGNGSVTCASRESGVACSSADGTHGFELSRASYRLY